MLLPRSRVESEAFPKIYGDRALAIQAAKLMNDELAAVIASHPRRFRGVAILPVVDPEAMVAELHRAIMELGFVGAFVAVGPTAKRTDHPDYEHLYKVPCGAWMRRFGSIRHGRRSVPDYAGREALPVSMIGCWSAGLTTRPRAMFRIVLSGVFDRYPDNTHRHASSRRVHSAARRPGSDNNWPTLPSQ